MEYLYTYTKVVVAQRLADEVAASAIVTALAYITVVGEETVNLYFKAELSTDDETLLDGIVDAHVPTPMPQTSQLVEIDEPKDTDGSALSRVKVTKTGWHFEPRHIYWKTSTAGSMFSKAFDGHSPAGGTDLGDVTVKFYDASGTALTKGAEESDVDYQTRLTANCTKTVMDWHPIHDMEVVGGALKVVGNENKEAWGWLIIAPDVPANYGGSVPFLQGGCNIGMFREREFVNFDGRTPKFLAYDPVYKSNKLRVMIVHEVGLAIQILVRIEIFKA